MRGPVAIAGVGLAGCGEAPGWSEMEIAAAAAKNALDDAGLSPRDVDGIVIASTNIFMSGLAFAEHLGIHPKFTESSMVGGSSFVGGAFRCPGSAPTCSRTARHAARDGSGAST